MGIFGNFMTQVEYHGWQGISYGLYDTLVVSFSRFEEIKRLVDEEFPVDERPRVIGSLAVSHSDAFYCDEYGSVSKWKFEGGD